MMAVSNARPGRSQQRLNFACVAALVGLGLCGASLASAADAPLQFNRDIRPILSDNCFRCHGPDENHREADLRLDDPDSAFDSGAIVPGDPDNSELVARILSEDDSLKMPPPDSNKRLTAEQRERLQRWIADGAVYQGHWAYLPPVRPETRDPTAAIDELVAADLRESGRTWSPEADRRTLIRRLSFDLTGLPPEPDRVDAFVSDEDPQAYPRLVDELLASPHFGERMAIDWLDVVRFADTIGYHSDNPRNVWPYRDYVIRSFNDNKPFDQFTIEQLAGDLLPDSTTEQRIGSCFNRLLLTTEEGGAQPKDYEARMLTDRVRAIGTVWLGQTLGCCQCHDHKFDPGTARDFYSMGAFFADIQEKSIGKLEAGMLIATEDQQAELARLDAEIANCRAELDAAKNRESAEGDAEPAEDLAALQKALENAQKARTDYESGLPHCLVSVSTTPRTVRILPRGNWMDESGPVVQPALPAYLPQLDTPRDRPLNRLDLAQWLVSRDHPLTARVFVNRLWKQFFGAGICRTLDDFGSQGQWPEQPELLDWLACEFMDSGWDVKHIVRAIVTSRTYRQSSAVSPELREADPENRLLARQSRYRLAAELVRDNALAISGLLVDKIGGPSVKPYQPPGYWENLNFPRRTYQADTGESQYRRGLYTWWQRSFLHPSLLAFDAPSREECCAERGRSNLPQQALVLMNDPTYVEAAQAFAARILDQGGSTTESRLRWAWRQTLCRVPSDQEQAIAGRLLKKHQAEFSADSESARAFLKFADPETLDTHPVEELAAWTSVARVLLNLHETITRS